VRTSIDLVAANYKGFWANSGGTFTYKVTAWKYKEEFDDPDNNTEVGVGFDLRVYIRGLDEEVGILTSELHEWTWVEGDGWTGGGAFPNNDIYVATITWEPETNTLTATKDI
jgi:hypothetical protein